MMGHLIIMGRSLMETKAIGLIFGCFSTCLTLPKPYRPLRLLWFRELILEYKNARSHLFQDAIVFFAGLEDTVTITEELQIKVLGTLNDAVAYSYDGTFDYDGNHPVSRH